MRELKDDICEKCGKPKIMYFRRYCPRCEIPEIKISYYMNLMECLYHIETTSHPGFKEEFWKYLISKYDFSNNTTIDISSQANKPLIQKLFKKMEIKDTEMLFEISW